VTQSIISKSSTASARPMAAHVSGEFEMGRRLDGASARHLASIRGRDFFVVTTRDNGTRLEWQYLGRGG
jgi:hypothetical protein